MAVLELKATNNSPKIRYCQEYLKNGNRFETANGPTLRRPWRKDIVLFDLL